MHCHGHPSVQGKDAQKREPDDLMARRALSLPTWVVTSSSAVRRTMWQPLEASVCLPRTESGPQQNSTNVR